MRKKMRKIFEGKKWCEIEYQHAKWYLHPNDVFQGFVTAMSQESFDFFIWRGTSVRTGPRKIKWRRLRAVKTIPNMVEQCETKVRAPAGERYK